MVGGKVGVVSLEWDHCVEAHGHSAALVNPVATDPTADFTPIEQAFVAIVRETRTEEPE